MKLATIETVILVFIFVAGIFIGFSIEPYIYIHPDHALDNGIPLPGSEDDLPADHSYHPPYDGE